MLCQYLTVSKIFHSKFKS